MCTEDQQTNRMDTLDSERVIMNAHTDYQVMYNINNRGKNSGEFKIISPQLFVYCLSKQFCEEEINVCSKISHSFFTWLESYELTHPPHLEDHLEDNDIKNLSLFDFNLFSWKGTRVLGRISSMFCSLPRSRRVLQVTILLFLKLKKQQAHRFVNRFWKRSFNNLFLFRFLIFFKNNRFVWEKTIVFKNDPIVLNF